MSYYTRKTRAMTAYKIERGIPLPAPRVVYPFGDMQLGDSFLVTNDAAYESVRVAMRAYGRKHGKNFTARKMVDGMRIWRTK